MLKTNDKFKAITREFKNKTKNIHTHTHLLLWLVNKEFCLNTLSLINTQTLFAAYNKHKTKQKKKHFL